MSWCQPQRRRGNERARARCRAAMALVRGGVARHDGHCDGSNLPKMRAWRPSIHPVRRTLATIRAAFVESGRALANRRLQPLRYLHDCSDCFRLERLPDGICTHWKAPPLHGAHPPRTLRRLWHPGFGRICIARIRPFPGFNQTEDVDRRAEEKPSGMTLPYSRFYMVMVDGGERRDPPS